MPRQITGAGKDLQARNVIKKSEIISSSIQNPKKRRPHPLVGRWVGSFAFRSLVVASFFYYSYVIFHNITHRNKVDHSMATHRKERQEPLITGGLSAKWWFFNLRLKKRMTYLPCALCGWIINHTHIIILLSYNFYTNIISSYYIAACAIT